MAKILFADDYPDALAVWTEFLELCGHDVLTAADGPAAVRLAHLEHPDAAVLDLVLPGLSGLNVARELRSQQDTSSMPLIAVTGHSDPRLVEAARRAGFDLVLTKPCDPSLLIKSLHGLLVTQSAPGRSADGMNAGD